jgi:adenylate cyclase
MAVEIERKFLVIGTQWRDIKPARYCQGYLNRDKNRTVRIRLAGDRGFITIKGKSTGASRPEFEYPIPCEDARQLLAMCDGPLIEKNRRIIEFAGMKWEIDEFLGDNAGLIIAEVELQSEDQSIEIPDWIGKEVTDDPRYFNSNLSKHPFTTW